MIVTRPRPWYLENGTRYPEPATISKEKGIRDAKLLPGEEPESDRIYNQMMFVPPNYNPSRRKQIMKTIYVHPKYPWWLKIKSDDSVFVNSKCPVDACRITDDQKERKNADLVIFYNKYQEKHVIRPPNQLYAMYYWEPPAYTKPLKYPGEVFFMFSPFFCLAIIFLCINFFNHQTLLIGQFRTGNYLI